jgi:predicted transcriptional regulator
MRTTINLPDELLRALKKQAAERGTTLTALIEDALRASLARKHAHRRAARVRLKTYGRGGLLPGVDLDGTASLLDLMDGGDGAPGR